MATLIYPERGSLAGTHASQLEYVPFLVGDHEVYLDDASRYLRERAVGRWNPKNPDASEYAARRVLSENTVRSYASDLQNFVSFLEAARLEWPRIDAQDLIHAYRQAMELGSWSSWGGCLAYSTVKRRVSTALDFLHWSSRRGERSRTAQYRSAISVGAPAQPSTAKRGRRPNPRLLRAPTIDAVATWLKELQAREGYTTALAAQFILSTGCRIEEMVLLRAEQLPELADVRVGRLVEMVVEYGTKGKRRPNDPELRGKQRKLRFDEATLAQLLNYKELRRPFALELAGAAGGGAPRELFLSERTGRRLSTSSFRKAWTACPSRPAGFTPHGGRHFFACQTLLYLVQSDARLMAQMSGDLPRSVLIQATHDLVKLYIQPVLGHVNEVTTHDYLSWVIDHLIVAPYRLAWSEMLDRPDA